MPSKPDRRMVLRLVPGRLAGGDTCPRPACQPRAAPFPLMHLSHRRAGTRILLPAPATLSCLKRPRRVAPFYFRSLLLVPSGRLRSPACPAPNPN
jgi:hypothetical protein